MAVFFYVRIGTLFRWHPIHSNSPYDALQFGQLKASFAWGLNLNILINTIMQRDITTRCINPTDPPLPPEIKIAEDGNAVRILGAWIGNETKEVTPSPRQS